MENKKDDLEELIKLATSSPSEPIIYGPAEEFIAALGIKSGDTKVMKDLIWHHYLMWAKNPVRYQTFFRDFNKIFPNKVSDYGRYHLLDPAPFDFSEDTKWRILARMRAAKVRGHRYVHKEYPKKNKKKSS